MIGNLDPVGDVLRSVSDAELLAAWRRCVNRGAAWLADGVWVAPSAIRKEARRRGLLSC